MKIAIVSPDDLSVPYGGLEIALELHKRLPDFGHESFLIAPTPKKRMQITNFHHFGSPLEVHLNQNTSTMDIDSFQDNVKIAKLLEKEQFEVVCVHEPVQPFLNWDILRHSKSTNIGWFHSTIVFDLDSFPYNLLLQPINSWLKDKLHGLIAVSPTAKHTWREVFEDRGEIITGGIDIKRFSQADKLDLGDSFNILFVGRLEKRKGILHAIRAFKEIGKQLNARLIVVGDGPDRQEAQKLVKDLDLGEEVDFRGRVSREDLPKYYKSANVYLAPATGGESLGIVLLEAMAAGTPIIAYANPGYEFTLSGTPWQGSLVKVNEIGELVDSVLEIARDHELRKKVINWQNKKVKEFSWDKIVKKFINYAESITTPSV